MSNLIKLDQLASSSPTTNRRLTQAILQSEVDGSAAIRGTIRRLQLSSNGDDEWDDWLDGDEHADSDADEDDD